MDRSEQLGKDKITDLLLRFSIPAVIGMLVNALYNIVDRIFIGNGVGSLGIAGITIGFPLMLILMGFGMLVAIGAASLISIKLGEKKKDEAELTMGNGIILLIGTSVVLSILGLAFLDPLLRLFGASQAVLPYARDYMQIILMGTVFMSIGFGMNNFIRAEGNPRIAMLTMLIGAVLNLILDPIFIFVFNWGMRGAALATILSQLASAAWVLYYFLGGKSLLKIHLKNFALQYSIVGKVLAIGAAPFALQMASSLFGVVMNNSLRFYGGDIAISGMGIIHSLIMLVLMPVLGLSQGVQPIIGYNYGAEKFDRVKEALKLAIITATAVVSIGFIIIQVFPYQLVSMFNREDPMLIEFSAHALRVFLIFLPIIGFQVIGSNYFQAVGKPKQAMFLSLSRQVLLLIPLVLILPLFFGLNGVLAAGPVSDLVASALTAVWILREVRNLGSGEDIRHTVQP